MNEFELNNALKIAANLAKFNTYEICCLSKSKNIPILLKAISKIISASFLGQTHKQITLAIDEAIRNSYEHGNLEINFAEKKILLENEKFEKELTKREEKFGHRKIEIKISRIDNNFSLTIIDEGNGFDWQTKLANNNFDSLHGRGLTLIQSAFDKVIYNKVGNSCTLIKKISE